MHLDAKREALGLTEYDPQRFGESGDSLVEEVLQTVGEGELLNVYSVRRVRRRVGGVGRCRDTSPRPPTAAPT